MRLVRRELMPGFDTVRRFEDCTHGLMCEERTTRRKRPQRQAAAIATACQALGRECPLVADQTKGVLVAVAETETGATRYGCHCPRPSMMSSSSGGWT